ncbi:MAG TPA: asparagine synthase (glutamine-hydrolyzing) [Gaiellaceae bacterium]|nr:asparagine synthase (glutamine-hydrolyzing) [Gaiellaceae bacterium]
MALVVCGICGVVQVTGEPAPVIDDVTLAAMTDVMTHRGPNDRGTYVDDGIALGVRRLSVIDVAGGHQPFANENGDVWAIQNGELYNHRDLRRRLERDGHRFRSRCDTEILPHLYERHGASFATELRGMFGIAVWDGRRRRAVLVRDRLGVKPLYYARCGDLLVFGSELKSVLASGLVEPELDEEAIDAYLTLGFVPGPLTPLAGVSKLLPGRALVVEDGAVRIEPYWRYPEPEAGPERPEEEYREELLAKLDESVRLRLMSDVPLGAMLSGGLDSSLVVALMARHMTEPVKTFSIGFREAGADNELADARLVAEHLGTEHHELELSFVDDAVDLEELVWHMDEPLADLSGLGFQALCRLAAEYVTVALCGQGADELLGGYAKHRAAAIVGAWRRLPGPAQRLGARLAPHAPRRFARPASTLTAATATDRLLAMSTKLDPGLRERLLRPDLVSSAGGAARRAVLDRAGAVSAHPLAETLYIDAQLALVDDMLHYFDRASMAHSLEVRVPFLDHELVELCARIPPRLKVRRLRTKHLLKEAARRLVPDPVIDKRKIGFFHASMADWFEAQATRSVDRYLLQPEPLYAEVLEPGTVRELVRGRSASDSSDGQLLLAILMLEIWLSTFLPRALRPPVASRPRVTLAG